MRQLIVLLTACVLVACAATGEPEGDRVDRAAVYERHAGPPEAWVRYTSIRNWWAVGLNSIVLEVSRGRHYLVDLIGPCSMDLDTAVALRLVNSRTNVLSEFDEVYVGNQRCQIQSIHELDYEAVKADLAENGASEPEKQSGVSVESEEG